MATDIAAKIAATWAVLEAEAKLRGLEVANTPYRGQTIGGIRVFVREKMTPDKWRPIPTGNISASVYGVYDGLAVGLPQKTFPEGKSGVNIAKVLDRVQECIAKRAELDAAASEQTRAIAEAADADALMRRKANALDRLECLGASVRPVWSKSKDIGWWELYTSDLGTVIGSTLLELAEALPDADSE